MKDLVCSLVDRKTRFSENISLSVSQVGLLETWFSMHLRFSWLLWGGARKSGLVA